MTKNRAQEIYYRLRYRVAAPDIETARAMAETALRGKWSDETQQWACGAFHDLKHPEPAPTV